VKCLEQQAALADEVSVPHVVRARVPGSSIGTAPQRYQLPGASSQAPKRAGTSWSAKVPSTTGSFAYYLVRQAQTESSTSSEGRHLGCETTEQGHGCFRKDIQAMKDRDGAYLASRRVQVTDAYLGRRNAVAESLGRGNRETGAVRRQPPSCR